MDASDTASEAYETASEVVKFRIPLGRFKVHSHWGNTGSLMTHYEDDAYLQTPDEDGSIAGELQFKQGHDKEAMSDAEKFGKVFEASLDGYGTVTDDFRQCGFRIVQFTFDSAEQLRDWQQIYGVTNQTAAKG